MSYRRVSLHPVIFRAYDIRGIIGDYLNEHAYFTLGQTLALLLYQAGENTVYVGRDGRLTSPLFADALINGLVAQGIRVYDLGEVTTPMLYYATHAQTPHSGFMVTGSHNGPDYNGLKMVLAGKTLVQDDIQTLYTLSQEIFPQRQLGVRQLVPVQALYVRAIQDHIHLQRPFRVVVDCGNGVAGPVVPGVLEALGCTVIPLYCEVDGHFPHHHPDPTVAANMTALQQAVLAHDADIGLGFDGDGDRLGVITERGDLIWPDRIMMFFAQCLLQQVPGATIVFDVKCSMHLPKLIQQHGGRPVMSPTGHSIVKRNMKEARAALAGEMSGHIFFQDRWFGFDDALYSACRLLEWLSASPASVSTQFAGLPDSVNTPEIQIPMDDVQKFMFMTVFAERASFPDAVCHTIDGVRAEFPYGFGLLRASNTAACLVARFEAIDAMHLARIQQFFAHAIQSVDPGVLIPWRY